MKEPSSIKKTNIYVPITLHAQLHELARQDRRSFNSEIIWLLEQAVASRQKGQADAPR